MLNPKKLVLARILMGLMAIALLALSCSRAVPESTIPPQEATSADAQSAGAESAASAPALNDPPLVDRSVASVPLADVVFDTFRGGFIRLSEASDSQIENLRDRIQPIYTPVYDGPKGAAGWNQATL